MKSLRAAQRKENAIVFHETDSFLLSTPHFLLFRQQKVILLYDVMQHVLFSLLITTKFHCLNSTVLIYFIST